MPTRNRGGWLGGDVEMQHAALHALFHLQAEVVQDAYHRPVLGQDVGCQFPDAVFRRVQDEVLEQQRAQAMAVHRVVQEDARRPPPSGCEGWRPARARRIRRW